MKKNTKGIILVEVIVALSIVFTIVTSLVPIITVIQKERLSESHRLKIANFLHDELQFYIWQTPTDLPVTYQKEFRPHLSADFTFITINYAERLFIKGCVNWTNVKQISEEICLFGLPRE